MNLRNIMLNDRSQTLKTMYCITKFIYNFQKKLARNYWIDKIKTMADFDKGSSGEVVGAEAYLGR